MMHCRRNVGRTWWSIPVLGAILLTTAPQRAAAQETGDPSEGHRLAQGWCVNCHVVDPGSRSGTSNGAPTFVAIAHMNSTTPLSLRVFLQTPHQRMPDFHLSREEIDDVISYIFSLREN